MPITPTTPTVVHKYDSVCDAIRDEHDEQSLWHLSDELIKVAPDGVHDVEVVVAQAKERNIPTKSANTLRLYRDVAKRFPATERITGVTFSAHREAIAIGDTAKAKQVLMDLAAKHGPAGVTVTTVKSAIAAATGKVSAPKKASANGAPVAQSSYVDVIVDINGGGKSLLAELPAVLADPKSGVTLDKVQAGLTAVLTHVETLRSKAARQAAKAKAAAKPSTPVNPSKSPAAQAAKQQAHARAAASRKQAGSKAGDLRGL